MFNRLVIGELGHTFAESLGLTTSVSSIPHQLVTDVRPKAEVYALLGIEFNQSLPDITILTKSVFPEYIIPERKTNSSNYYALLASEIHKFNINIMLFDSIDNSDILVDHYVQGTECVTINYHISRSSTNTYMNVHSRGPKHLPHIESLGMSGSDDRLAKLFSDVLASKVRKLITDTIQYYQLKQQKYLADNDLLPKYAALQSKVMEFFGIEDQSVIINELRQRNAENEAAIKYLTNTFATMSSLISKHSEPH